MQFFLIALSIAPLVFIGLDKAGGWERIVQHVEDAKLHVWKGLDHPSNNPMGVDFVSMVLELGLGFVLAFGY